MRIPEVEQNIPRAPALSCVGFFSPQFPQERAIRTFTLHPHRYYLEAKFSEVSQLGQGHTGDKW